MVGHLKGGIEDGIELPDRSNEVRLTARDEPGRNAGDLSQSMQPQMFAVEHALRLHELGMIKSNPNQLIAEGTDWRFLNEIKRELKS